MGNSYSHLLGTISKPRLAYPNLCEQGTSHPDKEESTTMSREEETEFHNEEEIEDPNPGREETVVTQDFASIATK